MYGKLAATGSTLAGVTVLGVTYPYLAVAAAALVVAGALMLRLRHKTKSAR